MFNLFGSFFFGRAAAPSNTSDNEPLANELTQTSNTDATTQTTSPPSSSHDEHNLLMVSHTQPDEDIQKQWVIVERARVQTEQQQVATSTTQLDDVKEEDEIVEEEAAPEPEQVEMAPTKDLDDDDDVLLGSFFDRNQFDESRPTVAMTAPARDEWLITPLPCLTSITCSQRSLVENDPLENLLIEHPSMSVFVTVTSSAMVAETSEKPTALKVATYSENVKGKSIEASLSTAIVAAQKKRKGMESTSSPSGQQQSPTSTMRRKANKRNKKSPSSSSSVNAASPVSSPVTTVVAPGGGNPSANKENMQVRTMLTSEFRSKANPAAKLDSILLSKNQMKRNNKHANKFNSNNCIQRKFHKLQQPVCC